MTVERGLEFFGNIPRIVKRLQTLYDVGLGYIRIGQSATTLSGGEAQRIKLSKELPAGQPGKHFMYWMNRPLACMPPMCINWLKCCSAWWTAEIPC